MTTYPEPGKPGKPGEMLPIEPLLPNPLLATGPGVVQPILTGNVQFHMPPTRQIIFLMDGKELFTVERDGTITKGEGFTTVDEMSLKFWDMVVRMRKSI
jgi:hypothetical protein